MGMRYLEPADREAIARLREVLRGEHNLSVAEEERMIAEFLSNRDNVVQGMPVSNWDGHSLELPQLLPGVVPSVVVCINFLIVIFYGMAMGTLDNTAALLVALFNSALFLALFCGLLITQASALKRYMPAALAGLIAVAVTGPIFLLGVVLNSPVGPLLLLLPAALALIWSVVRTYRRPEPDPGIWLNQYQSVAAPSGDPWLS